MLKGIIFDLDGTLLNTIGSIADACNYALSQYGYRTHEAEAYKDYVGGGLTRSLYNALPEAVQKQLVSDVDQVDQHPHLLEMVEHLVPYYEAHPTQKTYFYPGIEALLMYLKNHRILWGIHTNKSHDVAVKVADAFFDRDMYLDIFGPNQDMPRKPNPAGSYKLIGMMADAGVIAQPTDLLFVGDTEVDIETAQGMQIPVVAVTWGFRNKSVLKALNPDYMVDSPDELIQLIESLHKAV